MASPPPFDICDDLDDDEEPATAIPAHRRPNPAAPTPNGLNDRLLRLTRTRPRPTQNPNPNPNPQPPPEVAAGEARKVKLAGRRRLCKLSDSPNAQQEQDDDSIRDILDDLTTRLDSLSVHKTNAARPTPQHLAPLPCAITTDPDEDHWNAPSPLQVSSSDEAPTVITTGAKLQPAQPTSVASAFTGHARQEVHAKGVNKGTKNGGRNKAPSFVYSDVDDCGYDDGEEEEGTASAFSVKHIRRKPLTSRTPKVSTFRNYDDDNGGDLGNEKENRGVVENDAEDVGWEKTEDFKMEPTGSAATSKPYKLPGWIFNKLYPHQREGLQWLWVLHCRGTGGILGDDMGLGKTMQVSAFLTGLFHSRLVKRVLVVAPKTLLAHWTMELSVVGLKDKIRLLWPQHKYPQLRASLCFQGGWYSPNNL